VCITSRYITSREHYNCKMITDIVYNECSNLVSVFKDYLILDDISEFLKRYYTKKEAVERLPKVINFYEKYSKVFPNYICMSESKFMFKNIERKQRHIDDQQRMVSKIKKEMSEKARRKREYGGNDYSIDMFNR